jgi:hypothetical protein
MKKILLIINSPAYGADETLTPFASPAPLAGARTSRSRSSSWVMQSPAP